MKNGESTTVYLSNEKNKDIDANSAKYGRSSNFVEKFVVLASSADNASDPVALASLGLAPLGSSLEEEEGELGGEVSSRNLKEFNINIRRKIFLAAHYNAADLTLLKD